jgi:Fe-S-cluster containining protein
VPRCLSFFASYRCHRSGACCTSSWPIPVEADRLARIRAALANGALQASAPPGTAPFTFPADAPTDAPALLGLSATRCVFFDDHGGHRCRVQDALGHDALPLACRQFPRVSVRDPRGVSVALSAYCPTVARLLTSVEPVTIVESPSAFPDEAEYDGLDARTQLPPLLRPDRLMDWESWWAFEASSVDLLANTGGSADQAMARLRVAVEETRSWAPSDGPLIARVHDAFALATEGAAGEPVRDTLVRRFLAAHAFANWTMHLGKGLRTWLRSIEAAHELLTSGVDVREADLRLRHLADPTQLASAYARAELDVV